jgi:hypothetical protein
VNVSPTGATLLAAEAVVTKYDANCVTRLREILDEISRSDTEIKILPQKQLSHFVFRSHLFSFVL